MTVAVGLHRGGIELRHSVASGQDIWGVLFFPVIAFAVMWFLAGNSVPGMDFSLGTQAVPGILGMNVVLGALSGLALVLTMERGDGTLLRAKATPHGVAGYLVGKVVSRAGLAVVGVVLPLVPALFLFDGLVVAPLTLLWVLALGLVAVLPFGAILGAVFPNVQSMSVLTLVGYVLLAVSGIFYPITALPAWLEVVGQVFPVYWLGLGLRSALLPDALAAAEVGESWRHFETVGVLGLWAVVGFVLAPIVLRRLALPQ
jgi:ABC-2 type transport system permease protein